MIDDSADAAQYREIYGSEPRGLLWEHGLHAKFKRSNATGRYLFTEPIQLTSAGIHIRVITWSQELSHRYSVLLYKQNGEDIDPIGHFDFSRYYLNEDGIATSDLNTLREINDPKLPEDIKRVIQAFSGGTNTAAIQISDRYRGQGFGKKIWAIGCAVLEDDQIPTIKLSDTSQNTGNPGSFFDPLITQQPDKDKFQTKFKQIKFASTTLSANQQADLLKDFVLT